MDINGTDIYSYGFSQDLLPEGAQGIPARVTAVQRDRFDVVCAMGEGSATLKASAYYAGGESFPTTGDFVLLDWHAGGQSRILSTLPRRTCFARNDFSGHAAGYVKTVREQVVAANFDSVLILQSMNRDFNTHRLERYLTLAWQSGAEPVVVLSKADLCPDPDSFIAEAQAVAPGAAVIAVSARTGLGLGALAPLMQPRRTLAFLGSSGVGKSTLVNALAGAEIMDTGGIREDDSRGRHTTTRRQLVMLPSGAMIIDTPGMRELGMWDSAEGVSRAFADVEEYLGRCRFADCTHGREPGCAVRAALEGGALSPERWDSYLKLQREIRFAADKSGRQKEDWRRHISLTNKQKKKSGEIRR